MNGKGYIYTVLSLMFGLVLLAMVSLYYDIYRNTGGIDTSKVRTDELHYFIESSKKDLGRALSISGRRGAIYMIDHVARTGTPLGDPQQSLKELILNSTLTVGDSTENVTYMENHTMSKWLEDVRNSGRKMGFDVNLSFASMEIYPYDAWNFIEFVTLYYNVSDKRSSGNELCRYEDTEVEIISLVPISGLEDGLYALNTAGEVRRFFAPGNRTRAYDVIATGAYGNGTGGGRILDVSAASNPGPDIENYNSTHQTLVNYTVFLVNITDYDGLSPAAKNVLNLSGGVINYVNYSLDGKGFAYIAGVSGMNAYNTTYAALKNDETHRVLRLLITDDIQNNLYYGSGNGSSFFDRLEGRLNLSEKYVNQSVYVRNLLGAGSYDPIGLESLVNVTEFREHDLYSLGVLTNYSSQTSLEYLYFQNVSGLWVYGTPDWFRLDTRHMMEYNLTDLSADPSLICSLALDENNGSIAYDRTRNANNGRITGNASRVPGKTGRAVGFDGMDDKINVTVRFGPQATDNITISLWVKPAPTQQQYADLVSKHGNGGYALEQSGSGNSNTFYFAWDTSGGGDWTGMSVVANLTGGAWQHYAVVKSGATVRHYVNGTVRAQGTGSASQISPNNLSITIGDWTSGGGRHFNGTVDDVVILDRALSAQEVWYEYEKSR